MKFWIGLTCTILGTIVFLLFGKNLINLYLHGNSEEIDKVKTLDFGMSYMWIMPTFSHPTGKRAHLMNVYTNKDYRRQGIARKMVNMLIDDARDRGATEISLDATESGRPLYESLGFIDSDECMVLLIQEG